MEAGEVGCDNQSQAKSASDSVQSEGGAGSWSFDDPDRPTWDCETVLECESVYKNENGTYAYSTLKGRRADGKKVFLKGRRFGGSMGDLQLHKQEWPEEFYRLPGLTNFMKGTGDEPDLLYRLDELVAAMADRPADPVFIAEGEKDTDTLWALGLIATTNPNGALNWKAEFNPRFAGRDVVVMVDNDDKGRKRATTICRSLLDIATSVKAVELPGLVENGDVTDWLDSGKTKDDLLAVVREIEPHGDFARDDAGRPYRSIDNALHSLRLLGVKLGYDEFAARHTITGLAGFGPNLDDPGLTRLRLQVEEQWHLVFAKERWADIVTDHARRNTYHPVRDYLNSLKWDGANRLDGWLSTYAGAEDNEYVRAVASITLIAAVRRVRQPGCKFDEMPVLEGEQGTSKSSAMSILAVHEDWFADDLPLDSDSKVLMERTAGRWLVELAELKGLRRGAVEHVKSMLSRRVDKARLAYGRLTTEQPRQCVFFGTTNDSQYLRDMTGNRRFWPVKVNRFDLELLRRDRDQLWAEAAAREGRGASIRLPENLWAVAGEQQDSREIGDPFFEILNERLDGLEGKIRASDIWEAVGLGESRNRNQDHNVRLSTVMQRLGWQRPKSKLRFDGRPQHAWVKGDAGLMVDAYVEADRSLVLGTGNHDKRPM